MVLSLDQVCRDAWARVIGIDAGLSMQQRLRAFGLVPGTWVRRRYDSPAGDVSAIELRGSMLALRKHDLHCIRVRV